MKASCPRCGRGTEIDTELGDFPVRCTKCGALLRRNSKRAEADEVAPAPSIRRIERGTLAGLLIARSTEEMSPTIIRGYAGGAAAVAAEPADPGSILRPESRKEIARAAARQAALRKAELRASLQSFSALGWAGLTLITLLLIGAIALKAEAIWHHPDPLQSNSHRTNP